ncbi:hypothetical protein CC79DRAFT_776989 [Sarocladium strictum]
MLESPHGQTSDKSQDAGVVNAPSQVPPQLKRRLLRIFSQSHHNVELCGCIQLDMLREDTVAGEDLFLLQSISALAALYITDMEAVQLLISSQPERYGKTISKRHRHLHDCFQTVLQ